VVILVLALLFSSPVFTVTNYVVEPNSYDYGLDLVKLLGVRTEAGTKLFYDIVAAQTKLETPLIELYVQPNDGKPAKEWSDPNVNVKKLRKVE